MKTKILSYFANRLAKKLDLVTYEELAVQSKVLSRTRAQLETLEKKVTELEEAKKK